MAKDPTPNKPVPPVKAAKPTPDELTEALRTLVVEAETTGDRDRPGVSRARELLDRLEKAAA